MGRKGVEFMCTSSRLLYAYSVSKNLFVIKFGLARWSKIQNFLGKRASQFDMLIQDSYANVSHVC